MEDDVDVWRYAILELHARNDDNDSCTRKVNVTYFDLKLDIKLEKKNSADLFSVPCLWSAFSNLQVMLV